MESPPDLDTGVFRFCLRADDATIGNPSGESRVAMKPFARSITSSESPSRGMPERYRHFHGVH